MLDHERLVKFLTNCCRGRAATTRPDINARNVKPGGERLFNVEAMGHVAKTIVNRQPKRKVPHPALLRIDPASRFYEKGYSIAYAQFGQRAAVERTGDLGRHFL